MFMWLYFTRRSQQPASSASHLHKPMKIQFPTIPSLPSNLDWRSDPIAVDRAFCSVAMTELQETWFPYALILFSDLQPEQITLSYFNRLLHQFLIDLDPTHEYRQRREGEYNLRWNEEGGISEISYGDGFIHPGFKLRAYASIHDNNVGGWTGILFSNHNCMRSQIYPVVRLAYEFSLWLQKQGVKHSITLSLKTRGATEVELPLPTQT